MSDSINNPHELVEQALKVHTSISNFCRLRDQGKIDACVVRLVDEIRNDLQVIPALICMREICLGFPADFRDEGDDQHDTAVYRDDFIERIQYTHRLSSLIIDNLTTYMGRAELHHDKHPNELPENALLDGHYPHDQQVKERLDFLSFWIENGELALGVEALTVWERLFVEAVYPGDKEACLRWFLDLMTEDEEREGTYLDSELHQDFFTNKILQVDPNDLTENGFKCFERFFLSVNVKEKKMILKRGYYSTQDLQLDGLDYVWRVNTLGPTVQVAEKAAELLVKIHAQLGSALQPSRGSIHKQFFDSCFDRLENHFDAIQALGKVGKVIEDTDELGAILRVLLVLEQYNFFCETFTPEELIDGRIAPCHHAIAKTTTTICSMEHVSKVSRQFSLLKQLAERITQLPATEETSEIVSIIQRVQTSPLLNPPLKDMLQPQDILAHDLNKLLLSSASSDVVFVVDGEEIPAHKLVLTTRLPYFEQLFSSGTNAFAIASSALNTV